MAYTYSCCEQCRNKQVYKRMKTIEARISERLERQIDALVEHGWFSSRDQILQEALRRFMEAHRPDLMERFLKEDVEWGLRGRS